MKSARSCGCSRLVRAGVASLALALCLGARAQPGPEAADATEAANGTTLSLSARKVYEQARSQLVQIRTVLKGRASQTSVGSGFVVTADGHIVTNFHVIQEASGARVTLADQTSYKAELVGAFPDRDLAVLKIAVPAGKLKPLPVGTSRDLQVGQQVYAIGNPFGLDFELTTGIVSVQVRAFTPEDALTIGRNVLALSESLADDLSKKARADYVKFAQEQVEEASEKLRQARQAMLEFRDRERSIDPNKEADSARLGLAKLRDELGRVRADYLTTRARTGEKSTVLVSLRDRIAALESLIRDAEARMTGEQSKDSVPISQNIRSFESVEIERQLAEKFYDAAMQSLQRAQFEASRRAMYLEVFVTPSLAEHPVYPRRVVSVLIVALASFGAWIFLLMIYYSVRDHV